MRRPAVEREGEVAERIGGVRGPVVHRPQAQRPQLVVVFGAVELERVDARAHFARIEPALGQSPDQSYDASRTFRPVSLVGPNLEFRGREGA